MADEPDMILPVVEHTAGDEIFEEEPIKVSLFTNLNDGHRMLVGTLCLLGRAVGDPALGPVHVVAIGEGLRLRLDVAAGVGVIERDFELGPGLEWEIDPVTGAKLLTLVQW